MDTNIFRTVFKPQEEKNQLSYDSKTILFGSCFSENIGEKLSYYKFDCFTNPYGILFNPIAIKNAISEIVEKKIYCEDDIFQYNDLWHSFQHHSCFSTPNKNAGLKKINESIQTAHSTLKNASHIIITLGTSWVYENKETETIVANCHKVPQKSFNKKLLSVSEITSTLDSIEKSIHKINSNATLIYTVSPVRHLKDGMIENALSKANLLAAIHQKLTKNTYYFPSFEIIMDDLRDYRFYEKDMLHPNEIAIDYIWEIFTQTWITKESAPILKEVDTIQKGLSHKPFNEHSEAHQNFLKNLNKKIEVLKKSQNINF